MKIVVLGIALVGIALVAFVQSAGGTMLNRAPETVLMLMWGFALLAVASGARSLLIGRQSPPAPVKIASGAHLPRPGLDAKMVVASRS